MASDSLRDSVWYRDADGWSEVAEQVGWIARTNERATRAIATRIRLIRRQSFREALESGLIKKPSPTIYVLRVESGPVSYRLPFFEPLCRGGKLIVFTHCAKRSDLRGARYGSLIEAAERRRQDWIERNCTSEDEDEN
jgi:hypothetical protein